MAITNLIWLLLVCLEASAENFIRDTTNLFRVKWDSRKGSLCTNCSIISITGKSIQLHSCLFTALNDDLTRNHFGGAYEEQSLKIMRRLVANS